MLFPVNERGKLKRVYINKTQKSQRIRIVPTPERGTERIGGTRKRMVNGGKHLLRRDEEELIEGT